MERGSPVPLPPDAGHGLIATGERPPPYHLPPQPTRLIDREEELTRLSSLLSREEIRLLTLTGPGGVGKTRMAIAAAERVRERFPGGVWFVDLTSLSDPALVVPTIARVVGLREAPGQDLAETLAAFLSDRASLLVVDNLEHVIAAVPALDALLAACPSLTLLVTSREPLHLRREQVVEVRPLPVPSTRRSSWTVAGLGTVPAIKLFVDRAQAADADFALSPGNVEAVAELSRRLDGLPLAVELAAAHPAAGARGVAGAGGAGAAAAALGHRRPAAASPHATGHPRLEPCPAQSRGAGGLPPAGGLCGWLHP